MRTRKSWSYSQSTVVLIELHTSSWYLFDMCAASLPVAFGSSRFGSSTAITQKSWLAAIPSVLSVGFA